LPEGWTHAITVSLRTERSFLLEIAVETLQSALAAEHAGANRIELCSDLAIGGVTPDVALLKAVREQIQIPIFVMARPRGGNFVYSQSEFEDIKDAVSVAKNETADGVVLGILKSDNHVDVGRTRELVEMARPLPVTFHRAFDEAADQMEALEDVIRTGAARILTSGAKATALAGAARIAELLAASRDRIQIMPGAGITGANIGGVAERTRATEFHAGLGSILPYGSSDTARFESEIRKMVEELQRISSKTSGKA
jgi:copper homeostasis protein